MSPARRRQTVSGEGSGVKVEVKDGESSGVKDDQLFEVRS